MAKKKKAKAAVPGELDVLVTFDDPEHDWRVRMLVDGGFTKHQAFRLSMLEGLDYRTAVQMLERGADFPTIYDILS